MHWIYILQCEDGFYYVGETTRLYRRFWQHFSGSGGKNTSEHIPEKLVAIYKAQTLSKFFDIVNKTPINIYYKRTSPLDDFNDENEYELDNLFIENCITECLMLHKKEDWILVRGGKYTNDNKSYIFPESTLGKEIPICKCGFPCDIRQHKDNYLYFRCAKKNIWEDIKDKFDSEDEPCNFFMKSEKDKEYQTYYEELKTNVRKLTYLSPWLENLVGGCYEFCLGGCGKRYDEDKTIRYDGSAINLCFTCFITKHGELDKKYTKTRKRLTPI